MHELECNFVKIIGRYKKLMGDTMFAEDMFECMDTDIDTKITDTTTTICLSESTSLFM